MGSGMSVSLAWVATFTVEGLVGNLLLGRVSTYPCRHGVSFSPQLDLSCNLSIHMGDNAWCKLLNYCHIQLPHIRC